MGNFGLVSDTFFPKVILKPIIFDVYSKCVSLLLVLLLGVQDPQHERIITVSTNGSIHSPRFPHTYPRNMDLVWRLVAVEENVWIQLTFDERFGLEDPEDDICK